MGCNSGSVACIITGSEKGIGERYKINKLIVNMELMNQNYLIPKALELKDHEPSQLHSIFYIHL